MGEHNVDNAEDREQARAFMQALLGDLAALERMIEADAIESGVARIGAEQEMFLVDAAMRAAPVAPRLLADVGDARLTTEIARFNLEANLSPRMLADNGLAEMEAELDTLLALARKHARAHGADVLLAGILPTLTLADLTLDNLSPSPRYAELNRAMQRLRGGPFAIHIEGVDELTLMHENVMMEACCTSFQVHLQVGAREFARLYNLAQLVSAPLLAAATNSPLLLGQRLWHETRIALFQHAVDERSAARQARAHPPRVSFGEQWVDRSVLEIFRDEIARFRVVLTRRIDEDAHAVLARGGVPQLDALRLHNGTVWRWNRPCYGISDGKAHLRIENRALPAGPSVIDEMTSAAFFLGLMTALDDEYGDIRSRIAFADTKENFFAAARHGLGAQFTWLDGKRVPAATIVLDHLLPLARQGLANAGVNMQHGDRYLDVIETRVRRDQTGSTWILRSLDAARPSGPSDASLGSLTATLLALQQSDAPVHAWPIGASGARTARASNTPRVRDYMSADLFTVREDDLLELAANMMDWKHVRHVPVEDDAGRLRGIVSHRDLLRAFAHGSAHGHANSRTIGAVMTRDPLSVAPEMPLGEAINLMRARHISCLPVTEQGKLVGILTEHDVLMIASELLAAR